MVLTASASSGDDNHKRHLLVVRDSGPCTYLVFSTTCGLELRTMKLTPEMLVLIAPCVLLAGVVLQLLLARVLTPRGKGILAVLSCLPSLGAVLAMFPLVRNGASIDLTPLVWDGPLSLALHVDALSAM